KENVERPYGGNFKIKYDFDKTKLEKDWMFLRTPHEKWYDLNDDILSVDLRPQTCSGLENPSFLGHRQQHIKCSVSTAINFNPESENEKAGLLIFLNENRFYFLCKSVEDNQPVIQLYKSVDAEDSEEEMELLTSVKIDDEGT